MAFRGFGSLTSWLLALQVIACLFSQSNGLALIGIDFGTKFIKIGIVKPGKNFEIVLNEASKRKTENIVAFNPLKLASEDVFESTERLFSKDASGMISKKPELAVNNLKSFLDFSSEPIFGTFYEIRKIEDNGGMKINLSLGEKKNLELKIEEFFAMIIDFVKKTAVNFASEGEPSKADIFDCVITVPSHYDSFQRMQMKSAASIAGLNVLSLINENSGAAINYAVYKNFDSLVGTAEEEKRKENVLFLNVGHATTQASIAQFSARNNTKLGIMAKSKQSSVIPEVNLISHSSQAGFGGMFFDKLLVSEFKSSFLAQNPELERNIEEDKRVAGRLLVKANKVKEVLSANEQIPVSIESLVSGKDLKTRVSRQLFAEVPDVSKVLERVIDDALEEANITKSDLAAVELLGGAVRMPKIKSSIEEIFESENVEIGQHLNGDEAMALGAVFLAANISKTFRVKRIEFTEISQTEFNVAMGDLNEETDWSKETSLFVRNSLLRSKKVLSFTHDKDIIVQVTDIDDKVVGSYAVDIEKVIKSSGVTYRTIEEKEKDVAQVPKMSLTFKLTTDSLAELIKVEAAFVAEREIRKKVKKPKQEKKEEMVDIETKKENEEEQQDKELEEGSKDAVEDEEPEYKIEIKSKKHKVAVPFRMLYENLEVAIMDSNDIEKAKRTMKNFERVEDDREKLAFELNSLEGLIFAARDRIRSQENLEEVVEAEELEEFFEELERLEDWLYEEEASTATISDFRKMKADIAEKVDIFISKYVEYVTRDDLLEKTQKVIVEAKASLLRAREERPWVSNTSFQKYENSISEFETFFLDLCEKQKALDPKEQPVLVADAIIKKLESIQFLFEIIIKTKKPVPKPPVNDTLKNETVSNVTEETDVDDEGPQVEDEETIVDNEPANDDVKDEL